MKIYFHKNFDKQFKKLKKLEKVKAQARLSLFLEDPDNLILNNHSLKGQYLNYRSINITGYLIAIYKNISPNEAIFVAIDSHSNLYG